MRDNGKGDKPRPIQNRAQFETNWDAIFKKSKISDKVVKQVEDSISEYQKQAQELWFKDGSCTGGSPEQRD
jgi:hypothetical protein